MKIETARGEEILFDDEDAMGVLLYSWVAVPAGNERFYAVARTRPGVRVSMHRYLMQPPPGMVVHHKNNNGLDNRRENLVVTTPARNIQASRYDRPASVHLHKQTGRWRVQMRIDGAQKSFGMYDSKDEALAVAEEIREARLQELEAEFARAQTTGVLAMFPSRGL